jgi:tripartite-type tricarboxylate transporter receptor subunit TctC
MQQRTRDPNRSESQWFAGAGGNLGTVAAVRNAPDDYTLVIVHIGTMTLNPHLCANPAYDPLTDIAPIDEPPSDFTDHRLD